MRERRREQTLKRKNFLPSLIVTILIFLGFGLFIYFVDPDVFLAVPIFFVLLFSGLLFVFSLLFGNSRRGLVIAIGIVIFVLLRYFGVGNVLNLILIAGLGVTIEIYFSRKA